MRPETETGEEVEDRTRARQVGERISDAMHAAAINKAELARRVGVTPTTVSRWLSGENVPPWREARRVAQVLGVPTRHLLAPVLDDEDSSDDDVDAALLEAHRLIGRLLRARGDRGDQAQ